MIYSQISPSPETPSRIPRVAVLIALLALTGCSTYNPVALFHRYEGGAIGSNPPPAPGLNAPWPNLASVPARPSAMSAADQAEIRNRLEASNRTQNRLGGQTLAAKPTPSQPPHEPPLRIGFRPGAAALSHAETEALRVLASRRAGHKIAAIGFAPRSDAAGLQLALLRAAAIANALTASGVPADAIRIDALASGRGGAAQVIYGEKPRRKPISQDQS